MRINHITAVLILSVDCLAYGQPMPAPYPPFLGHRTAAYALGRGSAFHLPRR